MILMLLATQVAASLATPQLEPMAFLAGHCWQGTFADGKVDTHCFEPVYGGRFIRDRHEVAGGGSTYSGETLYVWNAEARLVEFTYWNSSGGVSVGTMVPRGQVLDFGDEVYRGADGRETRIATTWHRIDDRTYEARITSAADPTGSRVTRYIRTDPSSVRAGEARAPDGSTSLTHELVIPAPIDQVYAAVATAEGWRSWAVPNAWPAADDPDVMETSYGEGARPADPGNIRQRFLLRLPNHLVAFRTIKAPPGFPHAEEYYRVSSLFELTPISDGTRVRLTSYGYPACSAGETLLGFFRDGNRTSLEQLRTRFVSGPIDWAARRRTPAARQ